MNWQDMEYADYSLRLQAERDVWARKVAKCPAKPKAIPYREPSSPFLWLGVTLAISWAVFGLFLLMR